jgi:hypothetical protein
VFECVLCVCTFELYIFRVVNILFSIINISIRSEVRLNWVLASTLVESPLKLLAFD